jgi:hypothetical protein
MFMRRNARPPVLLPVGGRDNARSARRWQSCNQVGGAEIGRLQASSNADTLWLCGGLFKAGGVV